MLLLLPDPVKDLYLMFMWASLPKTSNVKVRSEPIYTKRPHQRCDDACDSVLIEINRVAPEWVCNPFSSDSTVFNEYRIASVIAALTRTLGVNGPLESSFPTSTSSEFENELESVHTELLTMA